MEAKNQWESLSEELKDAFIRGYQSCKQVEVYKYNRNGKLIVPDSWWEGTGQSMILPSSFLPEYVEEAPQKQRVHHVVEEVIESKDFDQRKAPQLSKVGKSDSRAPEKKRPKNPEQFQLPVAKKASGRDIELWQSYLSREKDAFEELGPSAAADKIWDMLEERPELIHLHDLDLDLENGKLVNKKLCNIPAIIGSNPIASVTNYFRHNLKADLQDEVKELPSYNPSEPDYEFKFKSMEIPGFPAIDIATFTHSRKKYAKEQAARELLKVMNGCKILMRLYAIASLPRS